MKKLFGLGILLASLSSVANAGSLQVNIYSGYNESGGGAPYTGLVGSFTAPDIMFATNYGYDWHPYGLSEFGADITGQVSVATSGSYTFNTNSDDGSRLLIDGNVVVYNDGGHGPNIANGGVTLAAGTHSLELQFFECCGGPSGVDVVLPNGVSYSSVPLPGAIWMVGSALVGLLGFTKRKLAA